MAFRSSYQMSCRGRRRIANVLYYIFLNIFRSYILEIVVQRNSKGPSFGAVQLLVQHFNNFKEYIVIIIKFIWIDWSFTICFPAKLQFLEHSAHFYCLISIHSPISKLIWSVTSKINFSSDNIGRERFLKSNLNNKETFFEK